MCWAALRFRNVKEKNSSPLGEMNFRVSNTKHNSFINFFLIAVGKTQTDIVVEKSLFINLRLWIHNTQI